MTLFDLTEEYLNLLEMAEDDSVDPQAIADTMEAMDGEFESKADGYARVIRQLEADVKAIKAEEDRLSNRRHAIDNNIKTIKARLQYAMELTGKVKFKTELFSFGIQKNPPTVVLDEQYIENIPEEYLVYSEPTVNKKQMIIDIRAGKDLEGIAHLEQSESLRIR